MCDPVYDLCIVGAGMFGSSAARHASAMAGVKICLIGPDEPTPEERSTREIFSSHYDEGRITRILDDDIPSEILSRHSIDRYRELEKLSGIQFYYPVGYLLVSKKDSPLLKRVLQSSSALNLPVVDLSYNDIFRRRFPFIKLKDDDHPLLDDMGAGHISPRKMVAAQIKVAQDQGCDVIRKVVNEVKPLSNGIHEVVTEGGEILKAKRILLCTGAFINLKKFSIPKLKMTINKETVALFKISVQEADRLSSMPSVVYCRPDDKMGAYILPPILYPDGSYYLKIGHIDYDYDNNQVKTLEEVKNWFFSEGDKDKIDGLTNLLLDLLPGLKYDEISHNTCVTSTTPSKLPYIDRVTATITVAAVGCAGAKISEEVGRIAATLSLTGRWDSELKKSDFNVILDTNQ